MQWPPDYVAEWNRRARGKNRCLADPIYLHKINRYYSTHPIEWIEDWCITYNPRRVGARIMPFKMFPRQRDFVTFVMECLRDKEGGLTEKSRDMGATWLCSAISVWMWKYMAYTSVGWGSRKRDMVDRLGDPDSIFEKIRMLIMNLPTYMLPDGFKPGEHMSTMRIVNPQNGSTITGDSGDDIGRGGRKTIYFKDESAHYERPESIEAALSENTDVQIDMSSVNGTNNPFYRRRMAGEIWYPGCKIAPGTTRVFIMDWRDHPQKTQEWHDLRERRFEREGMIHIFRQEVERDYSGSQMRVVIPAAWVESAIDAHIKLGFSSDGERIAGQDVADGGADRNALAIRHGVVLKYAEHWGGDAGEAAKIALPHCIELGVDELYYDCIGVGAGFKAEMNNQQSYPGFPQNLHIIPWNANSSVLNPEDHIIPGDDKSPKNEDQYLNLKAQSWFGIRSRFYKTFRAVKHGEVYDFGELISIDSTIPRLHELKIQLSQAIHKPNNKGKTMIDKQPDGSISPNLADSIVIAYSPTREVSIYDSL